MTMNTLSDELSLRAARLGKRLVNDYDPHHDFAIVDEDSAVLCTSLTQVGLLLDRLEAQDRRSHSG
jgi:hypothetical protein